MPLIQHLGRRNAVLAIFVAIAGLFIISERVTSTVAREPQRRQKQIRRRSVTPRAEKVNTRYSIFTHESHGQNSKDAHARSLKCNDCHVIPSAVEPDRIAAATKPSVTLGYPYHDSCLRCHQKEFYRGDRPAICAVCHARVAVRLTSRDVYSKFPSPKRGDVMTREFPGYYPHGLHQSLMARDRRPPSGLNAGLIFQRLSFVSPLSDQPARRDICASCHLADERGPVALPLKGIASEDTFKRIESDTFKTIPGAREANAHAACFNCHWEAQKPTKNECDGCHLPQTAYAARKLDVSQPPALSANALRWFEKWPGDLPKRFSLKFRHNTHTLSVDGKTESNNHDLGCTACHINIAQMTTLNLPKADVGIVACGPCHSATAGIPAGDGSKVTIFDEMTLKADISKSYTCVACHTSVIGREQPPCTHYSVIGQPCPKTRQSGKE